MTTGSRLPAPTPTRGPVAWTPPTITQPLTIVKSLGMSPPEAIRDRLFQFHKSEAIRWQQETNRLGSTLPKEPTFQRIVGAGWRALAKPVLTIAGVDTTPPPSANTLAIMEEMQVAAANIDKEEYLTFVYSMLPALIGPNLLYDTKADVIKDHPIPDGLPPEDVVAIEQAIEDMLNTYGVPAGVTAEDLEEISSGTTPGITEVDLVAPTGTPREAVKPMHRITTEEIIAFLQASGKPSPVLSPEAWDDVLRSEGYSEADLEEVEKARQRAEELSNMWKDASARNAAFRQGLFELPPYSIGRMLKDVFIQPGLAALETAGLYFEHVSAPIAGAVYKNLIPDIEKEYQKLRETEGTWKALSHAWEGWDSPNWFLKYVIMEGLTDPLSYFGWGVYARIVRPIPFVGRYAGRLVGAAERGFQDIVEIPFDAIKAGLRKLPTTAGIRALQAERTAVSMVRRYTEDFLARTGNAKPLGKMTMDEWVDAKDRAIAWSLKHPESSEYAAEAGREFLAHAPVDRTVAERWAAKIGAVVPDDLTPLYLDDLDSTFENFAFRNVMTDQEAATHLVVRVFGAENTEANIKAMKALLNARRNSIIKWSDSLNMAKNPYAAMKKLGVRNLEVHTAIEKSAVYKARMTQGRAASLLTDIDSRTRAIWGDVLDKYVVRTFAEAYLTFGMFGPMNMIEDTWRSMLGGVRPGRMNLERFEELGQGLVYDFNLTKDAISDQLGFLPGAREGEKFLHNNWLMQAAFLGNKNWSSKAFEGLVQKPGMFGMGMRRNFVGQKYLQILQEENVEVMRSIAKAVGDAPKLTAKNVQKNLQKDAMNAGTTGRGSAELALKDKYTHKKITRGEVQAIMERYPEMPVNVRNNILQAYDSGRLMNDIDGVTAQAVDDIVTEFLRGPEYAAQQFKAVTDELLALGIENPTDMAKVLTNLQFLVDTYGALPKQVIAQASIKSRGLKLAERTAAHDDAFIRLYKFIEDAGADIQKVIEKINISAERMAISPATPLAPDTWYHGTRGEIARIVETYNVPGGGGVSNLFGEGMYLTKGLKTAEGYAGSAGNVYEMTVKKNLNIIDLDQPLADDVAEEFMATVRRDIDVSDTAVYQKLIDEGASGDAIYAKLVDDLAYGGDLPKAEAAEIFESLKTRLADKGYRGFHYTGGRRISAAKEIHDVNVLWYPKEDVTKQAKFVPGEAAVSNDYTGSVNRAADRMTARKTLAANWRQENMAWRTEKFLTPKKERTNDWWDQFYAENDASILAFDIQDSELATELYKAMDDISRAGGADTFTRAPIKITDRPLAPADIARLVGARGDDVSRALMSTLAINDKLRFRAHIKSKIRTGDVGFTDDAIDNVYNQVVNSLHVRPDDFSAISKSKMSVEGMRQEFWTLKNAKALSGEDIEKIGKYLDDAARNVNEMALNEHWQIRRQAAMDEAHKWYFKEYPDYTNQNAFDSIMKSIYPFWTYESQRFYWLPRSFLRHPGTFTTYERWQDNTDYGYINLFGTSVDWNPFRGTVYGTLSTRLLRRDYPEYYDQLPLGGFVEGMDFLSRWGFYPNVLIAGTLSYLGGLESQAGEVLPSIHKSILNAAITAFPDSDTITFISERIFNDRFRDYQAMQVAIANGYEGQYIWTKIQEGVDLTAEEQNAWDDARREAAAFGIFFEQFGMFRMRPAERRAVYDAAGKAIEEMTGITVDEQAILRRRGERLWDVIGGLGPTEQLILEELDYFKWMGLSTPLLPGERQLEMNKQLMFWHDVEAFNESSITGMIDVQDKFLNTTIGPEAYVDQMADIYRKKREYIDTLKSTDLYSGVPVTLEEKMAMYEEHGIIPTVLTPFEELLNLYFSIELKTKFDEATDEEVTDWDTFFGQRAAIEAAIPEENRAEWNTYLAKNLTDIPMEGLRRQVNQKYFRPYNNVWEGVLNEFPENEQRLIKEYLSLRRLNKDRARQAAIRESTSQATGLKLMSSFQSLVSEAKQALRYANPILDAWLNYWGRVTTFLTPEAQLTHTNLQTQTGRKR